MDFREYYKTIDFSPDSDYEVFYAKQFDRNAQGLYVNIIQDGVQVTDLSGLTMRLFYELPDTTTSKATALVDGNSFRIDYPEDVTENKGVVRMELALFGQSDEAISTKLLTLVVNESLHGEEAYTYNENWIDIRSEQADGIYLLASDISPSYGFICDTLDLSDFTIDWGDGTVETCSGSYTAFHNYEVGTGQDSGEGYTTFKISITANSGLSTFKCDETYGNHILAVNLNSATLTSLEYAFKMQYGDSIEYAKFSCPMPSLTNTMYAFYNRGKLQMVEIDALIGTQAMSGAYMFYNTSSLKTIDGTLGIAGFGNVQSLYRLFYQATGLEEADISGLTAATTMEDTFYNCYALKKVVISNDLPSLWDMDSTFYNCISLARFNSTGLIGVTDLIHTFQNCTALTNIDMSGFVSVDYAIYAFTGCESLTTIDISPMVVLDDGGNMFDECSSLKSITMGSVPLTNLDFMFAECKQLEEIDISGITTMNYIYYMFQNCFKLKTVTMPDSCPNIGDTRYMFYSCRALESVDVSGLAGTSNCSGMFSGCYSLKSADMTGFTSTSSASSLFYNCYELESVTGISSLTSATNTDNMFDSCHMLTTVDLTGLGASTTANAMFQYCYRLESIDISPLVSVSSMYWMFDKCYSLKDVTIGSLPLATNLQAMFRECLSLESIDIGGFTNAIAADALFYECLNLSSVTGDTFGSTIPYTYLGGNSVAAFSRCRNLTSINLPAAKVTAFGAAMDVEYPGLLNSITLSSESAYAGSDTYAFNIANCNFDAAQLDALFGDLP
ncbi:MAG: leucine-rich repeat protein, partial [Candidatus Bathyarchaeota archaeon]|nr:leucine-rich repeat protein [Candidatus Bathyarchaeota archaeon]